MVGNTGLLAEVAEQAVEGARRHAKLGADLFVSFSAGEGAKDNCFLEGEGRMPRLSQRPWLIRECAGDTGTAVASGIWL